MASPSAHAGARNPVRRLVRDAIRDERKIGSGAPLSPREQEVVQMVAKGYPTKMIADVLEISPWTVGTYLRRIFVKLGVRSRAAVVARVFGTTAE